MSDGRFISYAQHGEDVILWRAFRPRTDVFYVDVGAYHPTFEAVTRALYERGWRGINIEAQPDRLAAFEEERPEDVNLAVAVGDHDGTTTLTVPMVPGWASTLAPELTGADPDEVVTIEVPLRTLPTILAERGITEVDVLKVDVEGSEPSVVRGMLDGPVRPTVCVVEGVAPGLDRAAGDEAVTLLTDAGYVHCLFDGLNHYLTRDPALIEALSVPANPLDDYVTTVVDTLIEDRRHQTAAIARLAAENAELRKTRPAPRVHDERHLPFRAGWQTPQSPAGAAPGKATAPGELPMPRLSSITSTEAGLAVPTKAVGAVTDNAPPRHLRPFVAAGLRSSRRRETFARLLRGATPTTPEGGNQKPAHLSAALESLPTADAVAALYRLILGREPDAEGLASWVDRLTAGLPLLTAAQMFAHTDEAQLADPTRRVRVDVDLATWAARVALHETGALTQVIESARPQQIADQLFVESLYEVALRRAPSAEELDLQLGLLAAGAGREHMIRAFAHLPEARAVMLGSAVRGVRGGVRTWRARRTHLPSFRSRVALAETRRLSTLVLQVGIGEALCAATPRKREGAT